MERETRPRAAGDYTGQLYRRQHLEKLRREDEEKRKKAAEIDYGDYLREAEHYALEEHPSGAIDISEARTNG